MKFISLEISYLNGSDMHAIIFMQYTHNEKNIDKFVRTCHKETESIVARYNLFSEREVDNFLRMKKIFDSGGPYDVDLTVKLSGQITIPEFTNTKTFIEWWEEVFISTKFPEWDKIAQHITVIKS